MASKKILIISEYAADFYSLGAALDRAGDDLYQYLTVNTRDQPTDSLMDPSNDAVILAYTQETEYLLRLAEKKNLALPIILLIDPGAEAEAEKLKAAGAADYVVRGFISDDMLHRVLENTIVLSHLKSQHEQLVRQQQIERSVQQGGEHLRSVAQQVGEPDRFQETSLSHAPDPAPEPAPGPTPATSPDPIPKPAPAAPTAQAPAPQTRVSFEFVPEPVAPARAKPAPKQKPAALVKSRDLITLALLVAVVLVGAALFQQRLDSEIRLAQLETSNAFLTQQLLQVQANMIRSLSTPSPAPASAPAPAPAIEPTITVTSNSPAEPVIEEAIQLEQVPAVTAPPISIGIGGSWFINLGTFGSHGAAQRFADSLRPTSHSLALQAVEISGRRLYRVRLVNLPSEELAHNLARDYELNFGGQRLWVGRD